MSTDLQAKAREYQILVQTRHKHWTQFEMDLITCIRDLHPVLYKKSGDWAKSQRGVKTKMSWKEIERKFNDLPVNYIRCTWKTIVDNYIKLIKNPTLLADSKYNDGTLNFLEDDIESIIHVQSGSSKTKTTNDDNDMDELTSSMDSNIRQLIHEEIDISDDENIDIKMEVDKDIEDNYTKSLEDNITLHDGDNAAGATNETETFKKRLEPHKKWDEEELLNATRLTKEMIEELIHIKTKHYFSAPVTTAN